LLTGVSKMKESVYGFMALFVGLWISACSAPEKVDVGAQRLFRITQADFSGRMYSELWTRPRLESLGMLEISSKYFDRAMHSSDSRFSTITFSRLLEEFPLKRGEDAVLLNCFDDYQGIISIDDIHRYDLRLATDIKLPFMSKKPDWLNPLLLVVPDGKNPPFQERFLTANIRELKFVRLNDYYSPLEKIAGSSTKARKGFEVFKNNCLFCHSLNGIGGNKGAQLLEVYDFSTRVGYKQFLTGFKGFHHKDNPEKQDVEQFVTREELKRVVDYLKRFSVQIAS
jgi:hypothetical protein